jgi:DNA repair protein RecO (recombination protein O)
MSLFSTEAIVLSTLKLGDADKLITFFTLTRGKIAGVASGARRFKNRFGASLEPFTQCHLIAFEKPGKKLARVNQADIVHSFQKLRDRLETIEWGTRMVRLIVKMTPEEQPHSALYHLLRDAFAFLETGLDRPLSFILFMAYLVKECGYQPQWNHCLKCSSAVTSGSLGIATFSEREGGILCSYCAGGASLGISADALSFFQSISKTDFRSAHCLSPSILVKREAETILKDYLAYILGRKEGR